MRTLIKDLMNVVLFGAAMIGSILAFKRIGSKTNKMLLGNRAMSSVVQRMSVEQFGKILHGEARLSCQIIDVRETLELHKARIPGSDIIHLPLSDSNSWSQKVLTGSLLDPEKPTLCLCHHGMRSMQVASFLGTLRYRLTSYVTYSRMW